MTSTHTMPVVDAQVMLITEIVTTQHGAPPSPEATVALYERLKAGSKCPPIWWLCEKLSEVRKERGQV